MHYCHVQVEPGSGSTLGSSLDTQLDFMLDLELDLEPDPHKTGADP
jgi:hypothetical protein